MLFPSTGVLIEAFRSDTIKHNFFFQYCNFKSVTLCAEQLMSVCFPIMYVIIPRSNKLDATSSGILDSHNFTASEAVD